MECDTKSPVVCYVDPESVIGFQIFDYDYDYSHNYSLWEKIVFNLIGNAFKCTWFSIFDNYWLTFHSHTTGVDHRPIILSRKSSCFHY